MPSLSRIARYHRSLLAVLLAGCTSAPPLPDYGQTPAFDLTRENGQAFSSASELTGKVWIADFIFTNCPGPCPRMTQYMKRLQEATEGIADLRLVSFTVDPERDTPEALAAYANKFGADPSRWCFLTGPRETLHQMSKVAFRLGEVAPNLEHSTRFALVDKRGRIRGYYATSEPSLLGKLAADAKRLVME